MVHAVVIRPHGPHRLKLSLSGKGDRKDEEEERGGDGEDHGGVKTSEIRTRKKKGGIKEARRRNEGKKGGGRRKKGSLLDLYSAGEESAVQQLRQRLTNGLNKPHQG